jgi:hypothetical protein
VITGFTPTRGFPGTVVTISGNNFTGATSVTLGGKAASFTVNSNTKITATVPSLGFSFVKWAVTTTGGTGISSGTFWVL